MAFVRAMASFFQSEMREQASARQALPPEATLRTTCPTLEISCWVHVVPGTVSLEVDAFPAVWRTAYFLGVHTSQQVSHPLQSECPWKN